MSQKRKRTSPHQIPDLRVGALSFRICFCQSQDGAAGTCGICTHIALGVGAAGGATKATVANVLKATRPRASGRSGGKPHKARSSTRCQYERARSKKLERRRTGSNNDYLRGVGEKKAHSPHRDGKSDVNVGSSSGSPVRSSACRIAKRHERHQTPAPSCLDATMGTGLPPSQVLPDANQDTVPTND